MKKFILFISTIVSISGSVFDASSAESVMIMSYNAHNLFDAEKDPGKNDWEKLPSNYPGKKEYCESQKSKFRKKKCLESNWTAEHVKLKIEQLKKAILMSGEAPDVIGLQEVENDRVVRMLADSLGGYNYVVTESPDRRGIDVAFLYKNSANIKLEGYNFIRMQGENFEKYPTRDLLEVRFSIFGETVYLYNNHWPAQMAPAPVRVAVAKQVRKQVDIRIEQGSHVLLLGDFNTADSDFPHPFKSVLLPGTPESTEKLYDVEESYNKFLKALRKKNYKEFAARKANMPPGTYFYAAKVKWNKLDRFFVNKGLIDNAGLDVDGSSYTVHSHAELTQTTDYFKGHYLYGSGMPKTPFGSRTALNPAEAGYSDHFGVSVRLKLK